MNDSTAPGYLAPLSSPSAEDIDLDALIQPAIVGITGMADAFVVIKGQPIPPAQPGRTITWCAVGVMDEDFALNPSVAKSRYPDTVTHLRDQELNCLASFYGPQARAMAQVLRAGFGVGQNRDALKASGLGFVSVGRATALADFENTQYVRRCDVSFVLRRILAHTYPIRSVIGSAGTLTVDAQSTRGPATVGASLDTGPLV